MGEEEHQPTNQQKKRAEHLTTDDFKKRTSITSVLEARGFKVPPGRKPSICCPFHKDRNPSFSIDLDKAVWNCHAGCGGGSVIDLLAKLDGCDPEDAIRKYVPLEELEPESAPSQKIEKIYSYQDENGKEVFQVVRFIPKTFRQRHQMGGKWVWSMDGVQRVLYRMPEIAKSERVWIVEGEKDADRLKELGYCATCNVGGAGKWLNSYTETLAKKEVVLCGDNDEPGQAHIAKVFESICGKVKNARQIKLPPDFKDVSDFIAGLKEDREAKAALDSMVNSAPVMVKGVNLPIKALCELEDSYREHVRNLKNNQLDLGRWLPSLRGRVRGLVPGELVTIIANTGVGKTALLQNISKHAAPLPTILFELELPDELVYERYLGVHAGWNERQILELFEKTNRTGERLGEMGNLKHVFVCTEPHLTLEQLERYINLAELKIGERPKVVLLDYIQLMQGKGKSRYERFSNIAEGVKVIAKATRTIIVLASQISRPEGESPEVGLYDAKESGSIENSSGLVLGAWRDEKDKATLWIKVLKNTKGYSGFPPVECNFKGDSMQINEKAKDIIPPYTD